MRWDWRSLRARCPERWLVQQDAQCAVEASGAAVLNAAVLVSRPPGAQTVHLTFEGLRVSRTIADKLTRLQLRLPQPAR